MFKGAWLLYDKNCRYVVVGVVAEVKNRKIDTEVAESGQEKQLPSSRTTVREKSGRIEGGRQLNGMEHDKERTVFLGVGAKKSH